jgi:hypothetical protein
MNDLGNDHELIFGLLFGFVFAEGRGKRAKHYGSHGKA